MSKNRIRYAGLALALVLGTTAVPAFAQDAAAGAGAAQAQDVPTYASKEDTIHGVVAKFDGHYALTVRDDRGFLDNVQLHDGTIINPTGLTLHAGMTVTILGRGQGPVFVANQIDTPYHIQDPVYVTGYAYGDFAYPAPYFGWGYPLFGVSIGYGWPGWYGWGWHGPYWGWRGAYWGGGGYYGHGWYRGYGGYGGYGGYNHGGYGYHGAGYGGGYHGGSGRTYSGGGVHGGGGGGFSHGGFSGHR